MKFYATTRKAPLKFWPEKLVGKACGRALLYGAMIGLACGVVFGIILTRIMNS